MTSLGAAPVGAGCDWLVVPRSARLPAGLVAKAVEIAAAECVRVRVVIPCVLPATLPIDAAPARLVASLEAQRQEAADALRRTGARGRVEMQSCRSLQGLIVAFCARHQPPQIVLAGSAPWTVRRALHGAAPVQIVSSRTRVPTHPHTTTWPVLER